MQSKVLLLRTLLLVKLFWGWSAKSEIVQKRTVRSWKHKFRINLIQRFVIFVHVAMVAGAVCHFWLLWMFFHSFQIYHLQYFFSYLTIFRIPHCVHFSCCRPIIILFLCLLTTQVLLLRPYLELILGSSHNCESYVSNYNKKEKCVNAWLWLLLFEICVMILFFRALGWFHFDYGFHFFARKIDVDLFKNVSYKMCSILKNIFVVEQEELDRQLARKNQQLHEEAIARAREKERVWEFISVLDRCFYLM